MRKATIVGAVAMILGGCDLAAPDYQIEYHVTGSARGASLTIQNETDGTEQMDVRLPWSRTMTKRYGDFVYVSAQNLDTRGGSVSCVILVNGQPWKQSHSYGHASIASCNGSVGAE